MSSFTEPLIVKYDPKRNLWVTTRSFVYYVGEENARENIFVPDNFVTDFASVPRPAEMLIPKTGKYNQAAVLHDYLYSQKGIVKDKTGKITWNYSRKDCDKIFLEAMAVLKVPFWKRQVMYRAVRIGGWLPWRKKR